MQALLGTSRCCTFSLQCCKLIVDCFGPEGLFWGANQGLNPTQSCQSRAVLRQTSLLMFCFAVRCDNSVLWTIRKTTTPAKGSMKGNTHCVFFPMDLYLKSLLSHLSPCHVHKQMMCSRLMLVLCCKWSILGTLVLTQLSSAYFSC